MFIISIMNNSEDNIMVNTFHQKYIQYWDLTIHVMQIGWNACNLKSKLDEDSRINRVTINGKIYDANKMRFIMSAFDGSQVRNLNLRQYVSSSAFEFLAEGMKNCTVTTLNLYDCQIGSTEIEYLANVLRHTCITVLKIHENRIGNEGIKYLAEGLKMSKVIILDVGNNGINHKGIKYLADVLEVTNLFFLSLNFNMFALKNFNDIGDRGVLYLVEHLKHSNITFLDLNTNNVTNEGARYLAQYLKDTCVTSLRLDGNKINDIGLRSLAQVLKDTQITRISYSPSNIEKSTEIMINQALSHNQTVAGKVKDSFMKLVAQNTDTCDLEFIVPNETQDLDMKDYLDFIRTVNDTPNIKGHIIQHIKENECHNYPNIIQKINEFLHTVANKFNTFFNNKLPDIVNAVGDCDYVDLLNQFEELKYSDIVQNFLLHRQLFYVDENHEILHPYVYKTLNKYNMTLYNEQLEPNKKEEIITYYENHKEINGAQEIVDLLKINSL